MDIGGVHLPTFIGATGGAGIAFTAVYGTFSRFEKIQSRKNRLFVSRWLLGLQVPKEGSEEFFVELFNRLFGPKHWSVRCAIASFVLSASLIAVAALGVYLGFWEEAGRSGISFQPGSNVLLLAFWVAGACLVDYFSLWKTRLILTRLSALRSTVASLYFIIADFVITSALFCLVPFVMMFTFFSLIFVPISVVAHLWPDRWMILNAQYDITLLA